MRFMTIWVLGVVLMITTGCGGDTTNPTPAAPSAGVPFTITDLVVGDGAEATPGTRPVVNYTGWLYDADAAENKGAQFDTGMGFTFTLGAGQVIAGWDQGVNGMRVGGLRQLIIPPELAYGSTGSGPIPPNATLVFDIELVSLS